MNAHTPTRLLAALCLYFLSASQVQSQASRVGADPLREFDPAGFAGVMEACAEGAGADGKWFLPLRKTKIQVEMCGAVVETSVTQQFKNETRYALEAVYLFPLPAEATITGMGLRVGRRVLRSRVMEREAAERVYENAKGGGIKTALLEQERPNLFTTSVANLLPGETVRVQFSYTHLAEYSRGKYALSIPMTHGPRYIPADGGVPDAGRLSSPRLGPTVDPEHRVSFQLHLAGIPVGGVTSNTHAISCERRRGGGGGFDVSLAEEIARADRDLEIEILIEEGEDPALSLVPSRGEGGGDPCHVLLNVFPPHAAAAGRAQVKRDVVFVIDTSGSMQGEPIQQARTGLSECLSMLGRDDAFTILRFSSDYSLLTPGLRKANRKNLARAQRFVARLEAGGGTEMQAALGHALEIPGREDALRLVIFLTDGNVGNERSLRRLILEKLGRARLFALGIGAAPNEFLMRKMAGDGRGQARFIRSKHDIGDEIADLFGTLAKPVLTDIELVWRGEGGELVEGVSCYPKRCPDVFGERPLQVVAKLPTGFQKGSLDLVGRVGGEPFLHTCPLELGGDEGWGQRAGIASLFGRARIDDLMQSRISATDAAAVREVERAIAQLGLEYQLVTEFTSRVAVDDRGSRIPSAPLDSRRVPVPMPHGTQAPAGPADPRLRFPKPMFVGTPVAVRLPNLERPGRPRLSLNAPPEAVLLSAGMPVSSSDRLPIIGDLGMITDGDRDGADGSYLELGPGLQWVQIDLGKSHELFSVILWHFHKNARAYLDVIVQISDDPEFLTGVTTLYNNDHDDSAGLGLGRGADLAWIGTNHGRIIDIPGKRARYVRLYSRGNTANEMNHYIEVEVFGKP